MTRAKVGTKRKTETTREQSPPTRKRGRRRMWLIIVAIGLVLALVAGIFVVRWLTTSTPVTPRQALGRLQEQDRELAASTAAPSPASPAPRGTGKDPAATAVSPTTTTVDGSWTTLPERGVYTWKTKGYEKTVGFNRDFPPESERVLSHADRQDAWVFQHLYSQEHEEEVEASLTGGEAVIRRYEIALKFGPFVTRSSINFDPDLVFARFPLHVGDKWNGSWKGDISGTYEAKTFEERDLVIEGKTIKTWANEVRLHVRGDFEGDVIVRFWIAPEEGMTLKESYHFNITKPGPYEAEWDTTLEHLDPRTS